MKKQFLLIVFILTSFASIAQTVIADRQKMSYDPSTKTLSLENSDDVDLSGLSGMEAITQAEYDALSEGDKASFNGAIVAEGSASTTETQISAKYFNIGSSISASKMAEMIAYASEKKKTLVFPKSTYSLEKTEVSDIDYVSIDFNGSTINFSGTEESQGSRDYSEPQISFVDCDEVKVVNANFVGPLFYGIDKEDIPAEDEIGTNFTTSSISVKADGCGKIDLKNINAYEVTMGVYIIDSNNVKIDNVHTLDTYEGFNLNNITNLKINNSSSTRAKYNLYENTYGVDPTEYYIGTSGSGALFSEITNGVINNLNIIEAGSNSIRVNGDCENLTFNDCTVHDSARHGFSVYNSDNENITFNNCAVYDISNPLIWTGSDEVDTFNRPSTTPVSWSFSGGGSVYVNNCKAYAPLYNGEAIPTVDSEEHFNSKYQVNLVSVTGQGKYYIDGGEFIGHTKEGTVYISSDNVTIKNATIERRKATTDDAYLSEPVLYITGDGCIAMNNTINYGSTGVRNNGDNCSITGNTVNNPYYYSFLIKGTSNIFKGNTTIYWDGAATFKNFTGSMIFWDLTNSICLNNDVLKKSGITATTYAFRTEGTTTGNIFKNNAATSGMTLYYRTSGNEQPLDNNILNQDRSLSAAAPTTGTWAKGDIVYNSNPIAGGSVGWICVNATGSGTWKEFGTIAD